MPLDVVFRALLALLRAAAPAGTGRFRRNAHRLGADELDNDVKIRDAAARRFPFQAVNAAPQPGIIPEFIGRSLAGDDLLFHIPVETENAVSQPPDAQADALARARISPKQVLRAVEKAGGRVPFAVEPVQIHFQPQFFIAHFDSLTMLVSARDRASSLPDIFRRRSKRGSAQRLPSLHLRFNGYLFSCGARPACLPRPTANRMRRAPCRQLRRCSRRSRRTPQLR